jgi:K+-sensing histidine kinase KdpD
MKGANLFYRKAKSLASEIQSGCRHPTSSLVVRYRQAALDYFAASLGVRGILRVEPMRAITEKYPVVIGVALSAVAALSVSLLFARVSRSALLPLLFAVVQVAIAARFGVRVSVLGSISAAIIFATVLYAPTGSLAVENPAARANLAWMVLVSIAASYLLLPDREQSPKDKPPPGSHPGAH